MFKLQDALSAIKEKPEFRHSTRAGFSVIDYIISNAETFQGKTEFETLVLKNLRGTCFNDAGDITRLGFEKFHNLNGCQGYMESDIDFSKRHHVLEKLDGSCIFQIRINDSYRLGTRAGITDISNMAEEFILSSRFKSQYDMIIGTWSKHNFTSIFEFTSRKNKVVIDYPEAALTLLAVRNNTTGWYLTRETVKRVLDKCAPDVPLVKVVSTEHTTLRELSTYVRGWNLNSEGIVISFEDGLHVKCKNDEYVRKHSCIDLIKFEKNVLKMIVENTIDDILPIISEESKRQIAAYAESVKTNISTFGLKVTEYYNLYKDLDRKSFAEIAMRVPDLKKFLFSLYNQNPSGLLDFVIKNCSSQTNVDSIRNIIGKSYYVF